MRYENNLKKIYTKVVSDSDMIQLRRKAIINSYEQVIDDNGKTKIKVVYTKYNMHKYEKIVEGLIEDRYSVKEEIGLTNDGIKNPEDIQYIEYRNYVDECKAKARAFVEERDLLFKNQNENYNF